MIESNTPYNLMQKEVTYSPLRQCVGDLAKFEQQI
jgi:hypothetical protein